MSNKSSQLVITKDDYEVIISYLNGAQRKTAFDRGNAEELKNELKKAILVEKDNVPLDLVRLNSRVTIKSDNKGELIELILVTPDKADIRQNKISIMAPIGTALIGFRQGQKVSWKVPAGNKTFTILDVRN